MFTVRKRRKWAPIFQDRGINFYKTLRRSNPIAETLVNNRSVKSAPRNVTWVSSRLYRLLTLQELSLKLLRSKNKKNFTKLHPPKARLGVSQTFLTNWFHCYKAEAGSSLTTPLKSNYSLGLQSVRSLVRWKKNLSWGRDVNAPAVAVRGKLTFRWAGWVGLSQCLTSFTSLIYLLQASVGDYCLRRSPSYVTWSQLVRSLVKTNIILRPVNIGFNSFFSQQSFFFSNRFVSRTSLYSLRPVSQKYSGGALLGFKKRKLSRLLIPNRSIKWGNLNARSDYSRYYRVFELRKYNHLKPSTRFLYSHYFNAKILAKQHLLTNQLRKDLRPFPPLLSQSPKSYRSAGLSYVLDCNCGDNLYEYCFRNLNLIQEAFGALPQLLSTTHRRLLGSIGGAAGHSLLYSLTITDIALFLKPLFKFFLWPSYFQSRPLLSGDAQTHLLQLKLISENKVFLNASSNWFYLSNFSTPTTFNYTVKYSILQNVVSNKYLPRTTSYFYSTLINFIEFYTGRRVYLRFNPFIENALSYLDISRCYLWYSRVAGFQKILGHRIFVYESLRIFYLAIKFRDPTFLSNWIKAMLYRMSFWRYRVLFRYIKYVFQNLFSPYFSTLNFKGMKLTVRGKISVAGNARTRTLAYSVGSTSHSQMNNRILSHFTTIHSFTGVMGFRLTFFY